MVHNYIFVEWGHPLISQLATISGGRSPGDVVGSLQLGPNSTVEWQLARFQLNWNNTSRSPLAIAELLVTFKMVNGIAYHLPNLHDVVFWHGADDPRFILVPWEVWDLGRVTAVNELHRHTAPRRHAARHMQLNYRHCNTTTCFRSNI